MPSLSCFNGIVDTGVTTGNQNGGESGVESTWWAITAAISGTFSRFIKRRGSDLPADRNRGSVQPI